MRKQALQQLAGIGVLTFVLAAAPAAGQNQKMETPKYGGTLEIVTVYATISALSWDNYDYNWKHNHDTGQVYEQLFADRRLAGQEPRRQVVADRPTPTFRPSSCAANSPRSGS